jgi:hypothetical protein
LKILLLFIPLIIAPAFAEPLSDKTGFKVSFDVDSGNSRFTVESISNFDIRDFKFEDGKFIFDINSGLQNNFAEFQIPQNLTKGELRFYVDGNQTTAKVLQNPQISFVTLEFAGNGTHVLEIASDFKPSGEEMPAETEDSSMTLENPDSMTIILAVVGIMAAIGVGSTIAVLAKRKKS